MYHYVYRLDHIETGEFYIGSRSSKVHPSLDAYLGSMSIWKPNKTKLKKIILKDDFENRDAAMKFEAEEISKVINEDLNRNYHIPNKKFHTVGVVIVKDKNGKNFAVDVNDPRYLSGELNSIHKGKIIVKDKDNNIFEVDVNDPRYLSGELTFVFKNTITVKDVNGKSFKVDKDDPKYLAGDLVGITKNKVTVKDKNDNTYMVDKNDPRYLSGELIPFWTNRILTEEHKAKIKATKAINQNGKGEKNSQYGTCWINNKKIAIKIKKYELDYYISLGWYKGRKFN